MLKFTEEDKKWLEAHNAKKLNYYTRKEVYQIELNKTINITIETNVGSNKIMVSIYVPYMSKIEVFDENMISAIKIAIDQIKYRAKQILSFCTIFNKFQL